MNHTYFQSIRILTNSLKTYKVHKVCIVCLVNQYLPKPPVSSTPGFKYSLNMFNFVFSILVARLKFVYGAKDSNISCLKYQSTKFINTLSSLTTLLAYNLNFVANLFTHLMTYRLLLLLCQPSINQLPASRYFHKQE